MERLTTRIATRKAIPRELHSLRESLECLPALRAALGQCDAALLRRMEQAIEDHSDLALTIARAIVDDPPGHLREGGVIRHGHSDDLDELIDANEAAKRWIADLERRERERSGISNLKVGFNRVFGYFIEVSKAHQAKVPDDYIAKQTLVNSERYYTATLKEKEQIILESEERRARREQQAFDDLCGVVESAMPSLQNTAHAVAQVDVLQSLAGVARERGFKRPIVDDSLHLELVKSRHPVVEQLVKEAFVPNDLSLDRERRQFALITGPNMSGKSTFLRQVAVVVVLAQMGSFVPAERARVGLIDQIFTRVGASDRLSRGESTFLVEMKETAYILDHITDRSLVLLDEVGRGTSTYDGLSIAWAVTEYLLQGIKARPKTLFATHFHELTQLHSSFPRLLNLKIAIREWEGGVIFLRKIVPGTSDRSYGIHAARVAGVPPQVLGRANEILQSLEQRRDLLRQGVSLQATAQMGLFAATSSKPPSPADPTSTEIVASIDEFDVDNSTPMQALDFVQRLKKRLSD